MKNDRKDIYIRGLKPETVMKYKMLAKQHGQSLNAYMLELLEDNALSRRVKEENRKHLKVIEANSFAINRLCDTVDELRIYIDQKK